MQLVRNRPLKSGEKVAKNPVEKIASNPVTSVAVMVFSALISDFPSCFVCSTFSFLSMTLQSLLSSFSLLFRFAVFLAFLCGLPSFS